MSDKQSHTYSQLLHSLTPYQTENLSSSITLETITQQLPLSSENNLFIHKKRDEIQAILEGRDRRLLLIVGPCALQPSRELFEYAQNLCNLQKEVESTFLIVMRAYFEKARSINGWKGAAYSHRFSEKQHTSLEESLYITRHTLLQLTSMQIPLAAEFIDPLVVPFFSDNISWGSIGARTIHSQTHRILASALPFPCGMKNSVEGSIEAACQAIKVAQQGHHFLSINSAGKLTSTLSTGNPYPHIVLRGGPYNPNYFPSDIAKAENLLSSYNLNRSIIIDCSHGNSQKQHTRQPEIFQTIISNYLSGLTPSVRGAMIESFMVEGCLNDIMNGKFTDEEKRNLKNYVSHVDPCIDWASTEKTVRTAHHKILLESINDRKAYTSIEPSNTSSPDLSNT